MVSRVPSVLKVLKGLPGALARLAALVPSASLAPLGLWVRWALSVRLALLAASAPLVLLVLPARVAR